MYLLYGLQQDQHVVDILHETPGTVLRPEYLALSSSFVTYL